MKLTKKKGIKRSQVFTLDLIFATVIMIISLAVVFNYYTSNSFNQDIYSLNFKIMNLFTTTEVNDLNSEYIRELFIENAIQNIHNTVAQQVMTFVNNGNETLAKNLTKNFLLPFLIKKDYNFEFMIYNQSNNNLLFDYKIDNTGNNLKESQTVSQTQRLIITFDIVNKKFYFDILKIKIWQ